MASIISEPISVGDCMVLWRKGDRGRDRETERDLERYVQKNG